MNSAEQALREELADACAAAGYAITTVSLTGTVETTFEDPSKAKKKK